jgi:acyl-coenzyme A thioesterase PaaI-like protein
LERIKTIDMIKLKNPYADLPGYNCFGCSPANASGLRMVFFDDGDEVVSLWKTDPDYQGFRDILHGGIQSTMMDEIASWFVFAKMGTAGVTYQMKTRFRRPVHISKGVVQLRAKLAQRQRNIASIEVTLLDGEGALCSESLVDYFLLSREKAEKEMHYPGREAFYEKPGA